MTPKRVAGLTLPSGVEWTGKRRTVIHPVDCTTPGSRSDTPPEQKDCMATDSASDASDPDMPALTPLVIPAAQSARAALDRLHANHKGKCKRARIESEDQPTIFKDEGQGHKRRTQQRYESTLSR